MINKAITIRRIVIFVMTAVVCMIVCNNHICLSCEQDDLYGTWSVKIYNKNAGSERCYDYCSLTIDARGIITEGGAYKTCHNELFQVTGGRFLISTECFIEGIIEISNDILYFKFGSIEGNELIFEKI
ncbi:MAG: hypothetical protein ACMUIP_03355 [bacterium]